MDHEQLLVGEDRLEKTLVKAENVSLLRIPPPTTEDESVVDIHEWDLNAVVWTGKLKFIETEFIMNMNVHFSNERQIIQGNIILTNYDTDEVFGNIPYTSDGHNVKVVSINYSIKLLLKYTDKF